MHHLTSLKIYFMHSQKIIHLIFLHNMVFPLDETPYYVEISIKEKLFNPLITKALFKTLNCNILCTENCKQLLFQFICIKTQHYIHIKL